MRTCTTHDVVHRKAGVVRLRAEGKLDRFEVLDHTGEALRERIVNVARQSLPFLLDAGFP
jgi:hypothetical protein